MPRSRASSTKDRGILRRTADIWGDRGVLTGVCVGLNIRRLLASILEDICLSGCGVGPGSN
jgi:hypothetical protein